MNKKGQTRAVRELGDLFKAVVTGIIGLVFLSALAPIVSQDIVKIFTDLGIFLIILAIIAAIASKLVRRIHP